MAEYKKKKVKHYTKDIKNSFIEEIPMQKSKKVKKKPAVSDTSKKPGKAKQTLGKSPREMKVVPGNKLKIRRRNSRIALVIILISTFIILLSVLTPTGIVDATKNTFALIGKGSGYEVKLDGSTLCDVQKINNGYITVSQTEINGYNFSGKEIFKYLHGYEIPILETSKSRFLIYEQGGKEYTVYNYSAPIYKGETSNEILAGTLALNGTFALATLSDSYTSQVSVYNSKNEVIYTWFCADYIINDVILSDNGKTLVISAFSSNNGNFTSKIYVLKFNSATPVCSFDYNELVLSINSENNKNFYAVFENRLEFFDWNKYTKSEFSFDNSTSFVNASNRFTVAVTGREANKNDNTVFVYNRNGALKYQFNFENVIYDIALKGRYLYILSNRKLYFYNIKGECIDTVDCDFGLEFTVPIGNLKCAVFNDNYIKKIVTD